MIITIEEWDWAIIYITIYFLWEITSLWMTIMVAFAISRGKNIFYGILIILRNYIQYSAKGWRWLVKYFAVFVNYNYIANFRVLGFWNPVLQMNEITCLVKSTVKIIWKILIPQTYWCRTRWVNPEKTKIVGYINRWKMNLIRQNIEVPEFVN